MRIINPQLEQDLNDGKSIRLELGSGNDRREGFYSLDHLELNGIDVIADLNEPLNQFPDNCVDHLYSRHVLEHISEFLPLMREIYRIVKPDGRVEIIVPHFSNVYGYSDPTHVRLFGIYSMYYFVPPDQQPKRRQVPAFYSDVRFKIESIKIEFYRSGIIDRLIAPIMGKVINHRFGLQEFYERRLSSLFHAWQIRFELTPLK